MGAVWMRFGSELRARWRAWLALAIVFGIGSGAAMAALAGARRTDSAYPRLVDAHDGFDAYTGGGAEDNFEEAFERLKAHPDAVSAEEIIIIGAQITIRGEGGDEDRVIGFPDAFVVVNPSGRVLYETNRAKVLQGRLPDRSAPDEVVVPFTVRDRYGIDAGDEITVGIGFDERFEPAEQVPVRVVGVVAAPGDFEAVGQTLFVNVFGSPAMFGKYRDLLPDPIPDLWNLGFHLKGGPSAAVAFKQSVEREFNIDVPVVEPVIRSGVQKTMNLYAVALWAIGALIAVATVAVVGQTLARQMTLDSSEHVTLRALGFSPGRLVTLGVLRTTAIGFVAAVVAAATAYLGSPLFPIGPARIAEPFPGFMLDGTVVTLGAFTVLFLVPLITLIPSVRAVRSAGVLEGRDDTARSRVVQAASSISPSPATATGLRMALEPGRGRTAVPVRSTILAVAFGIAAVTASLGIGESMVNLIDNPALAGFTYDALLPPDFDGADPSVDAERVATLRTMPFVDRVAIGTALNLVIGGADSFLISFAGDAEIGYALIDGRAPTDTVRDGLPEIAIGPATARRMKLGLGDTVEFAFPSEEDEELEEGDTNGASASAPGPQTARARIVGIAALPPLPFAITEPGEGGVMTIAGVNTFQPDHGGGCCFVAFKKGTDLAAAKRALQDAGFVDVFPRTQRADLANLERISRLPIALTSIFAFIAAAALTHVLTTAVRRRRRELAVLKTLGFVTGQVRRAVAWQVTTIVVLAVAVGIPVGVAVGRWGWNLIASHFGVVSVPRAPLAVLAFLVPAAVVLGNVVAAIPARIAARTQPALVLRTE